MRNSLINLLVAHIGLFTTAAQPVITQQPQDQTVLVGASVTYAVTATGTPPLSYQWRSYANLTEYTSTDQSLRFLDPAAVANPYRFYRIATP